ncbi:MAG: ATP-binding protein, partial [Deltaproteobacteria bacterium]|nr:ATP-binding protein [Deltaproteobacteria bacterium]
MERGDNILAFGLPGRGKTHFLAALAHELILSKQYSVLFMPTFKLIQILLRAKTENRLDRELNRMAKIDLVIVDDLGYVQYSRQEMELFFT